MLQMPDIYKDKKVCLLGCGKSLEKYNIDFNNYDIVVGINRIYKTSLLNKINILYYSFGQGDRSSIKDMFQILLNQKNFYTFIGCPAGHRKKPPGLFSPDKGSKSKSLIDVKKILDEINFCNNKNFYYFHSNVKIKPLPLAGMTAVSHIINSEASFIDMFGFDFYTHGYTESLKDFHINHKKYHNIENNKKFLKNLINKHPEKIKWNI